MQINILLKFHIIHVLGFARVQNEQAQLSLSNTYPQQQPIMYSYNQPASTIVHPSFASRYPIPCHSASGPPQIPIGPPIQRMYTFFLLIEQIHISIFSYIYSASYDDVRWMYSTA
jgi:hypothetical protein